MIWQGIYHFLYGYYPYVAVIVLVFGTIWRFRRRQFSWTTRSSQLLRRRQLTWGSYLFHGGIVLILIGHILGFFIPHSVLLSIGVTATMHVLAANIVGGLAGLACLIGIALLTHRRLFDPRIRKTSRPMDIYILLHLFVQLLFGLATIPIALQHLDGEVLLSLMAYFQGLATLQPGVVELLDGVHWIIHVHLFLGITLLLVFPFTRLVHMLSLPLSYITRGYVVMRQGWGRPAA